MYVLTKKPLATCTNSLHRNGSPEIPFTFTYYSGTVEFFLYTNFLQDMFTYDPDDPFSHIHNLQFFTDIRAVKS